MTDGQGGEGPQRVRRVRLRGVELPEVVPARGREAISASEALRRVGLVGNCSFSDAIGMLQPRYGRGVSTESVVEEYIEGGPAEASIIAGEIARLTGIRQSLATGDKMVGGMRIREKPDVLERKMDILNALRQARRGRYIWNASQLGAVMVYCFGFEPYQLDARGRQLMEDGRPVPTNLLNYLNAARYLPSNVVSEVKAVVDVARTGVLRDMHTLLFSRSPGQKRVLTTDEIIDSLDLYRRFDLDCEARIGRQKASWFVSVSGGVLESMGLVAKLSKETHGSHTFYRWVHRAHSECRETIPSDSVDYAIIEALALRGRIQQQDLTKEYVIHGRRKQLAGIFGAATVNKAVKRLEAEGVIKVEKEHTTNYVDLTPVARSIMQAQQEFNQHREAQRQEPYLLEDTRRLILGSYARTPAPKDVRRADMIVRGVGILRRIEAQLVGMRVDVEQFFREGGGGVAALLRAAGERRVDLAGVIRDMHGGGWNAIDHSYADDMVRDGTVPWRGVTLHTMRGTYLPLIENAEKQGDVEEGTCDYLKKRVLPELKK